MKYTQEEVIELAKEVAGTDQIDWDNLPLDKDKIYQMIGSQAYEVYGHSEDEDHLAILLATVIHLLVENFVLNLQIPGNNIQ